MCHKDKNNEINIGKLKRTKYTCISDTLGKTEIVKYII